MNEQLLQGWLEKIRSAKEFLETVENKINEAEFSISQVTGFRIAYDFDVEDLIPDIESASTILNELQEEIDNER